MKIELIGCLSMLFLAQAKPSIRFSYQRSNSENEYSQKDRENSSESIIIPIKELSITATGHESGIHGTALELDLSYINNNWESSLPAELSVTDKAVVETDFDTTTESTTSISSTDEENVDNETSETIQTHISEDLNSADVDQQSVTTTLAPQTTTDSVSLFIIKKPKDIDHGTTFVNRVPPPKVMPKKEYWAFDIERQKAQEILHKHKRSLNYYNRLKQLRNMRRMGRFQRRSA